MNKHYIQLMVTGTFLAIMALVLVGDSKPHTDETWKSVKKIDAAKFAGCMQDSQKEGKSLKDLRKECEDYAEIIEARKEAVKNCYKMKSTEIGWTKRELDLYCNKLWRGYR